ncbi:MAG: hypothetical protein ACI9UA_002835 [Pseudoalteromonas tetraodonis]|jgi:uncharacterized protein YbbC (DUF1343 family)
MRRSDFLRLGAAGAGVCALPVEGKLFGKRSVSLGIDRLVEDEFAALAGKRVGLVTNQSGVDGKGRKTRLVMHAAKEVNLVALFAPEHGLDGVALAGKKVASGRDAATGLPVHSLYGKTRKPTAEMLRGVDVLVFDMQDVGARCYTYVSTMGLCMEAAAQAGKGFVVLDRPNPLGGERVEGPPLEPKWKSFVGMYPVPFVHGLTAGELAQMANGEGWLNAKVALSVVPMGDWKRSTLWPDTGKKWVRTSPNIPNGLSPFYYIASGITGHLAGADVGTGTSLPFEYVAGKGVDPDAFARRMNTLKLRGVSFSPYFTKKKLGFGGARMKLDLGTVGDLAALDVHLMAELHRALKATGGSIFTGSSKSVLDVFYKVYGSDRIRREIESDKPAGEIVGSWGAGLRSFRARRQKYLLY